MHHRREHPDTVPDRRHERTRRTRSYHTTGLVPSHQRLPPQEVERITRALFSRPRTRLHTGEQWTRHLITFLWTQGHTLWKDQCTTAHGPADDRLDKSSTRTRQTEQQLMSMAYASSSLMLAIDRRMFDITLEERLQGRTSDIAA
jgi:hypothetical protein